MDGIGRRPASGQVARRIIVSGRVQGVGYRWFAREAGRTCGVDCTALNLADGTVQIDATGSSEAMAAFIAQLRKGPPHAKVTGVAVEERGGEPVADAVRRTIRDIPDFPKPGILFKDITPVLLDAALFARSTAAMAAPFAGAGISHVVAIESRGFILGAPVAQALRAAFVPVRKPGKLPGRVVREEYALEYGTDALEMHADALVGATRVLVVDDVLATGGTAAATCRLVERGGGSVTACAFLVELSFLGGRAMLGERRTESLVIY
jgi:adenine phosphoribosyltransferase